MKKSNKNFRKLTLWLIVSLILVNSTLAYKIENGNWTHQHITNESQDVSNILSLDIKNKLTNGYGRTSNSADYDYNDDMIDGSKEEDLPLYQARFLSHFWNPDNPSSGDYNDGLGIMGSSWNRAEDFWNNEVIDNYRAGNIDEAYYWLGRIAHLLEDASQPSHVHLDPHPGGAVPSILEDWTGNNWQQYDGKDYANKGHYYYDALIPNFDWSNIEPETNNFLFRLFWYTAQKTQYWASDRKDGNTTYRDLSSTPHNWECNGAGDYNLWADTYTSCGDFISDHNNLNINTVEQEANATVPHAMRAVAGLYRLFEDTIHSYEWPTYGHDYRRTGFTLLKGDITSNSFENNDLEYYLGGSPENTYARMTAANYDQDDNIEVIITTSNGTGGDVTSVEKKQSYWQKIARREGTTNEEWRITGLPRIRAPMSIGNTDIDGDLEMVVNSRDYKLLFFDELPASSPEWTYTTDSKFSPTVGWLQGRTGYTAMGDLDGDGEDEIIFGDGNVGVDDWPGEVYVFKDNGATYLIDDRYTIGRGGTWGAPALGDIDSDGLPEIIVPGFRGIHVFDYNGNLVELCQNDDRLIQGSVTLYDIDRDNAYEAIYTTSNYNCIGPQCSDSIKIIDNFNTCTASITIPIIGATPLIGPSVANIDLDSNLEIIVLVHNTTNTSYTKIRCYDSQTLALDCEYPQNGWMVGGQTVSPNIADINGDGYNDIIYTANSYEALVYTPHTDTAFTLPMKGRIGSSPIIADIDQDGVAELAIRRAGSPVGYLTIIGGENKPPLLGPLLNMTSIAGELVDVNKSNTLDSYDFNPNDVLEYQFSSPFSDNGTWQSTVNDTGNYSITVQVTDGNMSDYNSFALTVFNYTTQEIQNFSDGDTTKTLNYTGNQAKTMNVIIPKNALVVHAEMDIGATQ